MKFQHFFWDFDGTLFDTYARITRAIQKALKDLGVEATYEEIFSKAKISIGKCLAHFTAPLGIEKDACMAAYHAHAEEEPFDTILLYPGAREMLEEICRRGGKNYVYTHRGASAREVIALNGMEHLFADYVTSENGFPSKPAPNALQYLMEKHGLKKDECIMIGDRGIDVESGLNAGMNGALIDLDGMHPADQAPYRADSFEALHMILLEN
ncbi:MAG: HAD family hydrolase [Clostridiales bacterium]|nr:HAD family hydrolase [Clostridiales bacterium]